MRPFIVLNIINRYIVENGYGHKVIGIVFGFVAVEKQTIPELKRYTSYKPVGVTIKFHIR